MDRSIFFSQEFPETSNSFVKIVIDADVLRENRSKQTFCQPQMFFW